MTKVERALLRDRIERTVAGELKGKHAAAGGSAAMWRRAQKVHAEGRSFR